MKLIGFVAVVGVLLFFYTRTLLPTVGFWDTGEFQAVPYVFWIAHPTGYPTYVILGKIYLMIFPVGTVAWRMNLFSAITVSLACGIFYLLLVEINRLLCGSERRLRVGRHIIAVSLALAFGLSRTVWDSAVRAEVHTLHLFFTALFLFLVFKIIYEKNIKRMPILSLVVGLSLGNHMLSAFFLPVYLLLFVVLFRSFSLKEILLNSFLLLLGISVYLLLPILTITKNVVVSDYSLLSINGLIRFVLGSDFSGQMHAWTKGTFLATMEYYFEIYKINFPWVIIFASVAGFAAGFRKAGVFNIFCLILLLSTLGFSLRYQNAALERYFLTSFLIFLIWAYEATCLIYSRSKLIITTMVLLFGVFFQINQNYSKVDLSQNYQAERFAERVLTNVEGNATVVTWWSYYWPLWYMTQVENFNNGVKLYSDNSVNWEKIAKENIISRPVYLIDPIQFNDSNLSLESKNGVFKVIRKE